MFGITAVFSFYLGWQRFMDPEPIANIILAYAMLVFGILTNLYAFSLSFKRLLGRRDLGKIWRVFWESNLVETKTAFTLDLMGTLAGTLGFVALVVYGLTGDFRFDGIGAMVIGVMLGMLSLSLLVNVKDLLIGKSAPAEVEEKIREVILTSSQKVKDVLELRTILIGMDKILVDIEIHLIDGLTTDEIERLVDHIEDRVREEVPSVQHIQVEFESPDEERVVG